MRYPLPQEKIHSDQNPAPLSTGPVRVPYLLSVKPRTPKDSTTSKLNSSPLAKDGSR